MNSQAAVPKQNTHQQQQQRNIRPNKRKGSDSSIPDEEKMKEEKYDYISRGGRQHFLRKKDIKIFFSNYYLRGRGGG